MSSGWLEAEFDAAALRGAARMARELDGLDEDGLDEDFLLEPSDTIELEAARAAAGLELASAEPLDEAASAEPLDEAASAEPLDEAASAEPLDEPGSTEPLDEPGSTEPLDEAASAEPLDEPAPCELVAAADRAVEPAPSQAEPEVAARAPFKLAIAAPVVELETEAPFEPDFDELLADAVPFEPDFDELLADARETSDDSEDIELEIVLEACDESAEDESAEDEDELEEFAASGDPIRVPAWSGVNSFAYAFTRGLRGMSQSPLVQMLAVGTMAVCMLLLGTTTLIFQNAQRVAHDLGVDTPITVYMDPDADETTAAALRERIAALPEVEAAVRVTPQMALARLEQGLGPDLEGSVTRADLLAGVDASSLPDSVEVALIPGVEPGFADELAARVAAMDGVEEVAVLGPWVQQVERMVTTLRWLAFGVAGLVSLACLAIVWSTIRLGVFARRSELEILRLVGGTVRFVRGPFVIEGVLQGVLGSALALACLWLSYEMIEPFLERGMALMFAAGSLHFFSIVEIAVALGFGALLGVIGARAAVARHAEV